ncbi:MAG: branched-chain amino acid ABC transporter permease [Carboxydocellales bacterium]
MQNVVPIQELQPGKRTWKKRYVIIPVIGLLLLLPFMNTSSYVVNLMTEVFIFGIFAMSLDLILGYTGMASLGHAAYFGLGAYAAGIVAVRFSPNLFIALPAAIGVATVAALIVGLLALRTSGVYFLMLTLAFSQMFYAVTFKWTWLTGGSDGLAGIPRPVLPFGGEQLVDFINSTNFYLLTLVVFLVCYFILWRIIHSPFGQVLVGIRENEKRMSAIGYETKRFKLASFVIAGAFGGVAGAFNAFYNGYASPQDLFWAMSGQVLVMVVMGGYGTLIGPVLGAGFFLLLQNVVSSYTERWPIIMGVIFISFVMAAPKGMVGIYEMVSRKVGDLIWKH